LGEGSVTLGDGRGHILGNVTTERTVTVVVKSAGPLCGSSLGRFLIGPRGLVPLDVDGEVDVGRDLLLGESSLEITVARSVGVSNAVGVRIAHPGAAEERVGSDVLQIATVVVGIARQFIVGHAVGGDVHLAMIIDTLLTFSLSRWGGRIGTSGLEICKGRLQQSQQAQRGRKCRANHDEEV
jgi:hypothetical protein